MLSVEDRPHTYCVHTTLYIQTQDREHCAAQETDSILQVRGQAALCSIEGRLAIYAHVQSLQVQVNSAYIIAALRSAGDSSTEDRQHCVVQGTGSIVQCRGQGALCSAGERQHCVLQERGGIA